MKVKNGVQLAGLQLPMRLVLIIADRIYQDNGFELVVTSGLEGTHSPGSLHYYGYALDFRIFAMPLDKVRNVVFSLRQELGDSYQVIQHPTHIHVEYQEVLK